MKIPVFRALFAVLVLASSAFAQNPVKSQPVARESPALSVQERFMMQNTVLSDARVQQIVGAGQVHVLLGDAQPDKYEEIAFLKGESQKPPSHRVWATVFNPATNKAAEIFMSLEQNTVLRVQEIPAVDVPLMREDVEQALALAKASPDVRGAIGSRIDQFVVADNVTAQTISLAALSLRVRGVDPNDPCTLDRCLDLLFKTDNGFLPLRAAVDLTRQTVTVKNSPGKGKHP